MNSQEPTKESPKRHHSRRLGPAVPAIAVLAAILAIGLYAGFANRPCPLSAGSVSPAASMPADSQAQSKLKAPRQGVDKLVDEQKFEAAAAEAARIREEARKAGDNSLWTWALIKEGQLRSGLHGYGTALRCS